MELEARTLETVGGRCEVCGARLTDREQRQTLEASGRALCTVHAAEAVGSDDEDPYAE